MDARSMRESESDAGGHTVATAYADEAREGSIGDGAKSEPWHARVDGTNWQAKVDGEERPNGAVA